MSLSSLQAQVIKFHSFGSGGTTPSQASNGVITHFGMVSGVVSQGSGFSNQSGFFFATIDYRPSIQASALAFSSESVDNSNFSITVTWTNGNGARRLVLIREGSAVDAVPVDGTGYAANAAFGNGSQIGAGNYVVYDGIGNNVTVTGLANKVYHFKVFEYNGKYVGNNANIVYHTDNADNNPVAFSPEPVARPASMTFSDITATSMTVTFPVTNATGFLVLRKEGSAPDEIPEDGTSYAGTFGSSTVVHNGIENTFANSDLSAATTYHYALYAYNGTGAAINYLSSDPLWISKITVPTAPAVTLSNATSSNFNAEWTPMPSATVYKIDVSTDSDFTSFVDGYQDKDVTGSLTNITGVQPSTQYFVRVRAVNESGPSANSQTRFITTQSLSGTPLSITISQSTQVTNTTVSASIAGGIGPRVVKFYARGIRSTDDYTERVVTEVSDVKYDVTIQHAIVSDPLGLEFRFEVTDDSGTKSSTGHIYLPIPPNTVIPNLPFGGEASDYRMISIPYTLTLNNSAIVFSTLGAYDKTKWRFLNWNETSYVDNPSTISLGQAYWFNALTKPTVTLGEGSVSKNNKSLPFTLALKKGWNMIATPYPFTVNWNDILEFNGDPDVSEYYIYNGTGYVTSVNLEPWKGGFVFADNTMTLDIPVVFTNSSGGRKGIRESFTGSPALDQNWIVPITLKQGEHITTLNAFGMHEEALLSKDRFDVVAIPALFNAPDLTTHHDEYFISRFVRDVVPHQKNYVWSFTLNTSSGEAVELQWDNSIFIDNEVQLLLYDPSAGKLVDMRLSDNYTFHATTNNVIEFIFNTEDKYHTTGELTTAYPNPFTTEIHLPAIVNTTNDGVTVSVCISNVAGQEVFSETYFSTSQGLIQPVWKGTDALGNNVAFGVYVYHVIYTSNGSAKTIKGKIVKQ